jgi:mono/diheme cytochrome c family protein
MAPQLGLARVAHIHVAQVGQARPAVTSPAMTTRAIAACTVLLIFSIASFPAAAQPNEAEIDQGREVYGDFCLTCHGRDMVNPGGVTFDLRKFPKDDFERFRNAVLNGKPPAMPAWRDKIGDEDLKSLWAYVRSGG